MATKIQVRRDTAADWTSTNPTLAAGEIGFESDTNKFKIGDGATAWTSLNYAPEGYATTSYVDTQDANIASDTLTFTNKTFDANGTGNSISNIETADIAAGTLVTAAEGIGSNDNDTTIPTSAAVKAYADSVGGGTITALNNQAENRLVSIGSTTTELDGEANLTFDGSTLSVTGALTTTTSLGNDAVSIDDNIIKTTRSNDDLNLRTNGTGHVVLQLSDDDFFSDTVYTEFQGANTRQVGFISHVEEDVNTNTTGRRYQNLFNSTLTLTGTSSTNSNFRPRNFMSQTNIDMAGFSYTRTGFFRGPLAGTATVNMVNSSATASTMENVRGWTADCGAYAGSGTYSAGDITMNNIYSMATTVTSANEGGGAGTFTVTNGYGFAANHYCTSGGITNYYGFIYTGDSGAGGNPTNRYAFYDNENVLSRFGAVILANQAGDPSTVTDSAHIYAKDVSASSEVFVRDEAGNVTQISPHNEAGEWQYWSENVKTGKKVRINMEKMIRKLEEFTGETFIESE